MSQFFASGGKSNSFSFTISPSNEYSGLISFRIDWLDLLAVQGTLKSLLQHHNSKASILQHSAFFIVQLSHPYITTGKNIALTRWTFVDKVMPLLFNMLQCSAPVKFPRFNQSITMSALTILDAEAYAFHEFIASLLMYVCGEWEWPTCKQLFQQCKDK